MARHCEICGKIKLVGNHRKLLRGHRNVTGKRTFKPNLQMTRIDGERVLACVACIRTSTKEARKVK